METYITTTNANLRSSPRDPGDDSNKLATLPRGHWVNLIHVESGAWGEVWTIFKNKSYRGYIALSLITNQGAINKIGGVIESLVNRHRLFEEQEFVELKRFMSIQSPSKAKPSEALSLSRSREVSFDWDKVLSADLQTEYGEEPAGIPFTRAENISYFASYIISVWGLTKENYSNLGSKILYEGDIDVPMLQRKSPAPAIGSSQFETIFQTKQKAFGLKHPLADRLFFLHSIDEANNPISSDDFIDWQHFTEMLESKLKSAIPALQSPASAVPASQFVSTVEEVDMGPAIILRQYSELSSLKEFTSSLDQQATEFGKQSIGGLLSSPEIDSLISGVLKMKSPEVERRFGLEKLVDRASDLGYILNITDADIEYTYEDGTKITVKPGKLYQPYLTRIYWVTEHKRVSEWHDDGFFGIGSSSGRREWVERVLHEKEVIKYKDVPVDLDPWTERQDELLKREGLRSYRFEKVGSEYQTAQGDNLTDIIAQCERDETFRRQVAIWLPIYEQSLSKGQVLTKYVIFKRPYKGIMPVRFPKLYVEESLTYRTSWKSSELGDLVYTINLAPGEERTVTIEQKVSKQTEETRSTTSILDLTESDTLELSTEMEKEAKSSTETTRTSSWSASASGSYGPIGGSAGASGESKTTTAQFSRNMERLARKAAHNLTRKTQKEIKTSTSIRADFSKSESTTIKIHNINDGRTLNLLFFRLYNLYSAGVYVDNLRLLAESGVEIVAGSGITLPRLFELYDLSSALQVFDLRNLPFPPEALPGTPEYARLFNAYWSYVLDEFVDLLGSEYKVDVEEGHSIKTGMLNFSALLETISSTRDGARRLRLDFGNKEDWYSLVNIYRVLRQEIKRIERVLTQTVEASEAGSEPLRSHELRVASPGLFVDSFMGVRPATEPYAEEMRAQEVRLKAAEASRQQSLANYYNHLAGNEDSINSGAAALGRAVGANAVVVSFSTGVVGGSWSFNLDGVTKKIVDMAEGQSTVELAWDDEQGWIQSPENHSFEMQGPEGQAVPFVLLPPIEE